MVFGDHDATHVLNNGDNANIESFSRLKNKMLHLFLHLFGFRHEKKLFHSQRVNEEEVEKYCTKLVKHMFSRIDE